MEGHSIMATGACHVPHLMVVLFSGKVKPCHATLPMCLYRLQATGTVFRLAQYRRYNGTSRHPQRTFRLWLDPPPSHCHAQLCTGPKYGEVDKSMGCW